MGFFRVFLGVGTGFLLKDRQDGTGDSHPFTLASPASFVDILIKQRHVELGPRGKTLELGLVEPSNLGAKLGQGQGRM